MAPLGRTAAVDALTVLLTVDRQRLPVRPVVLIVWLMGDRAYEKIDPTEAADRAAVLKANPKVRAWMRRARRLFRDLPEGVWIYWQEDTCYPMVRGPDGETYKSRVGGVDQAAIVDDVYVPGSDAGAW